jgi:hypothetical protein
MNTLLRPYLHRVGDSVAVPQLSDMSGSKQVKSNVPFLSVTSTGHSRVADGQIQNPQVGDLGYERSEAEQHARRPRLQEVDQVRLIRKYTYRTINT